MQIYLQRKDLFGIIILTLSCLFELIRTAITAKTGKSENADNVNATLTLLFVNERILRVRNSAGKR